jgi:LPS transport system D
VRLGGNSILVLLLSCFICCDVMAADEPAPLPAGSLLIKCAKAQLWDQGDTSVAELTGPVQLELDHTKMSAENAVVWIEPNPDGPDNSHRVQIALIGKGQLRQAGVLRLDRRLLVKAVITGDLRLIGDRSVGSDESSPLYLDAAALRGGRASTTNPASQPTTTVTAVPPPATSPIAGITPLPALSGSSTQPTTGPTTAWTHLLPSSPATTIPATIVPPLATHVIEFDGDYQRAITQDGYIAAVCTNGVSLRYRDASQNLIEFVAHDMVLFTNLKQLKGAGAGEDAKHFISDHIVSAYFDGDVQVFDSPAAGSKNELRMKAERVYYEFDTDQAIMTDVLFHTVDLKKQIPMFMRASKLRQLSEDEFKLENMEMSSSGFFTPTFGIGASNIYVRGEDSGDPTVGERISFKADNATLNAFGVPLFWFPSIGGTMDTNGTVFRNADVVTDSDYGTGIRTKWGLFETLGVIPPKDLQTTYDLDYFSKRGPAGGIDGTYVGGFVSDTTKQPFNYIGDFHGYVVDDRGQDVLGAARSNETPDGTLRGRAYMEHEQFFPDDWMVQVRLGVVSDSNFMDQWFNDEYQNNQTIDDSIFVKHAQDSESYSLLLEAQPNRAITSANEEEENREISRLPEVQYDRVGDSIAGDRLTFFSENSGSALKFVENRDTLTQQGFYPLTEPGPPAYAYTGDPGKTVYRGDFRQEVDFPINAGPFKIVPYVFTRYTPYSAGVIPPAVAPQTSAIPTDITQSGDRNRIMGGGGLRLTTDFWKVDNSVESDIFDLHRLRHIVSPELNVFGSASNLDQDRLFIYDPEIDGINDVQAVQLALRQRWQTKRGGPGKWRSADVFTLNLYGNFFANQPENRFRYPTDFRGLYYYSNPEASVSRNSANADATWRISDTMTVLSDVEQNLDKTRLATASVGVAVQRDARITYFVGTRYIADLDSNVVTLEATYQLDRKYSVSAYQSLDLAQNKDVYYSFSLNRNFDNFMLTARVFYDQSTSDKGFSVGIQPFGAHSALGSDQIAQQQQD